MAVLAFGLSWLLLAFVGFWSWLFLVNRQMNKSNIYKRYRFPSEIIQYAVWLYYRFNFHYF